MNSKINFKTAVAMALALGFAAASVNAVDTSKLPPASTKTGVTYEKDMMPLFETSCVKCHHGEKPRARLAMDTLEGIMKGSKQGKVVIPGKSAESQLVLSIAYLGDDEDSYMPPPHNKAGIAKLTPEQIGLVRAWIDQGAK